MWLIDADLMFKCETCRHHRGGKCNTYCDHGEEYSPNLRVIPTINPEHLRPKGEWIEREHEDARGNYKLFHCSRCDEPNAKKKNYCPNCGADMRGK